MEIPSIHDSLQRQSTPARLNEITNTEPTLDAESKPQGDIEDVSYIGVSSQTESIKTKESMQQGQMYEIVQPVLDTTAQKSSPGQTEASLQPDPLTPAQTSSPELSVASKEKTIVSLPTPKRNPLHAFSLDTNSPPRLAVASRRMSLARHFASREKPRKRLTSAVSLDSPPRRTAFRRLDMTASKPAGSHVDRWSSAQQEGKPPPPPKEPVSETDEREEQLLVQQRQLDKLLMGMEQRRQAKQEKERDKHLKAGDTTANGIATGEFSNLQKSPQSGDGGLVDNASSSLSESSLHFVSEKVMQSMSDYDDMSIDGLITDELSHSLRSTVVNNTSLVVAEDLSSRSHIVHIPLAESRNMVEELESDATRSIEAQRTRNDLFDNGSVSSDIDSDSTFTGDSTNSFYPRSVSEMPDFDEAELEALGQSHEVDERDYEIPNTDDLTNGDMKTIVGGHVEDDFASCTKNHHHSAAVSQQRPGGLSDSRQNDEFSSFASKRIDHQSAGSERSHGSSQCSLPLSEGSSLCIDGMKDSPSQSNISSNGHLLSRSNPAHGKSYADHHSNDRCGHSSHNVDNSKINEESFFIFNEISSDYTNEEEFFEDASVNKTSVRRGDEFVRSQGYHGNESGYVAMSSEHSFCSRSGGKHAEESTTGNRSEFSDDESKSGTSGNNRSLRGTDPVLDKNLERSYNGSSRRSSGQGAVCIGGLTMAAKAVETQEAVGSHLPDVCPDQLIDESSNKQRQKINSSSRETADSKGSKEMASRTKDESEDDSFPTFSVETLGCALSDPVDSESAKATSFEKKCASFAPLTSSQSDNSKVARISQSKDDFIPLDPVGPPVIVAARKRIIHNSWPPPRLSNRKFSCAHATTDDIVPVTTMSDNDGGTIASALTESTGLSRSNPLTYRATVNIITSLFLESKDELPFVSGHMHELSDRWNARNAEHSQLVESSPDQRESLSVNELNADFVVAASNSQPAPHMQKGIKSEYSQSNEALAHETAVLEDTSHGHLIGNKSSSSPELAGEKTPSPKDLKSQGDLSHNIFATQVPKCDFSHLPDNHEHLEKPAAKEKAVLKDSDNLFAAKSNYFSFSLNEVTTEEMTASKSAAHSSKTPDAPLVVDGKQPSTEASVGATKRTETQKPKDDEGLQISGFLSTLASGPGQNIFGLPPVSHQSYPDHGLFRNPLQHPVAANTMASQPGYHAYSKTDPLLSLTHGYYAPQLTFAQNGNQPRLPYSQYQPIHVSGQLGGFEHPLYLQQQVNQQFMLHHQQQHHQLWLEHQQNSKFRDARPLQQAFHVHTAQREEISTSVAEHCSEKDPDILSAKEPGLNQFSDTNEAIASDNVTSNVVDEEISRRPVSVQVDVDAICDPVLEDPSSTMSFSAMLLNTSRKTDRISSERKPPSFSIQAFLGHVAEQVTVQAAEIFGLNNSQDDMASISSKDSKYSLSRYSHSKHLEKSLSVAMDSGTVSPTFVSYEEAMILFRKPEPEVEVSRPHVIQFDEFCTHLNQDRTKQPWETLKKEKSVQKEASLAHEAGAMGYWYAPSDEVATVATLARGRNLKGINKSKAKMSKAKALKIIGLAIRRYITSTRRKAADSHAVEITVEYEVGEENALFAAEKAREAKALSKFGERLKERRTKARITMLVEDDSDEEPVQLTCDKIPEHDLTIEPGQGYDDTVTVESDSSVFTTSSDERRREILAQTAPKVRSESSSSSSSFSSSFSETGSNLESDYSGSSYWSGSSTGSSSFSSDEVGTTEGKHARNLFVDLQNEDGDVLAVPVNDILTDPVQKEKQPNIDLNGEVVIEYVKSLSTLNDKNVEESSKKKSFSQASLRPDTETDDYGTQRSNHVLDSVFQPSTGFATLANLLWGVKDAVQPEFPAEDFEHWSFSDEDEEYDLADFELAEDEMDEERGAPSRRRSSMMIEKRKFRRRKKRKNTTADADQRWNNIWFRPPKLYIVVGTVVIIVLIVILSATLGKSGAPSPIAEPTPAPMTNSFADRTWNIVGDPLTTFSPGDQTGFSVSISNDGSRVAIGARRASEGGLAKRGNAKIYSWRSLDGILTWIEEASFDGFAQGDQFGFSVKLSADGKRLAVGSIGDDTNGSNSGLVRVFGMSGTIWQPIGEFPGEKEGDLFGLSVDLSADGKMLCVGAPYHSANGQFRSGKVYFYEDIGKTGSPQWESRSELFGLSRDDFFGWSLALNAKASRVAIGAPSSGESGFSGYAKMYELANTGTMWTRLGQDIGISNGGDRFGYSVSMDAAGDRAAVGAFRSAGTGEVNVFELNANSWVPLGDSLMGEFLNEGFGFSISLSTDGNHLAVGAPSQDNIIGGKGYVRIFEYQPSQWFAARDIVGMGTAQIGNSVALASGASRVAVGSPLADEASVYE